MFDGIYASLIPPFTRPRLLPTYCLMYCHHASCMTVNVTYCLMYCHHAYCMIVSILSKGV